MMLAARIGLTRSEWEDMTPKEISLWAHAFSERREVEKRNTEVRIYNLAALTRGMIWGKNAPSFESVFPDKRPKKAMSDEQMLAQVRRLNALLGGKEV